MYLESVRPGSYMNVKKIEKIIVGMFSASIFTSKPAIYVSSLLFLLYFSYRVFTDEKYKGEVVSDLVTVGSLIVFSIGLLSRIIYFPSLSDIILFSYKSIFLIIFPALVIALKDKCNRRLALVLSASGFILSMLYSYVQAFFISPESWDMVRVGGLWDVSRWAEITAMVFAFVLATLPNKTTVKNRIMQIIFMVMIAISLVLSGGRAGWVAVGFILIVYVIFINRKSLVGGLLVFCMVFAVFPYVSGQISPLMQRISSITETTAKDYSNYSRLLMWENGISLIKDNVLHAPAKFMFGVGFERFNSEYIVYINRVSDVEVLEKKTAGNYSLTDLHNSYIDALNKMGALYTVSFYGYVFMMMIIFSNYSNTLNSIILISPFLIVGFFYTNYIEFQTSMFFFIMAMYYSGLQNFKSLDGHKD